MTRLSARSTYFVKRFVPVVWLGFFALIVAAAVTGAVRGGNPAGLLVIVPFVLVFGGVSFFVFHKLFFELVDSVWDDGSVLVIRNRRKEERIPLGDILSVSYAGFQNPSRVTLYLCRPSIFGDEIAIAMKTRAFSFRLLPQVRDLMVGVDEARRRQDFSA